MPGNKLLLFGKTFLQWQWYSLFSLPLWIWSSRHWAVAGKNGHIQLSLFRQQLGDFHGKLWGALAHSYKSKSVQRETRRQYMTQLHFCKVHAAHHGPRAAVSTVLRTQHCDRLWQHSQHSTANPNGSGFPRRGAATPAAWAGEAGDAWGKGCARAAVPSAVAQEAELTSAPGAAPSRPSQRARKNSSEGCQGSSVSERGKQGAGKAKNGAGAERSPGDALPQAAPHRSHALGGRRRKARGCLLPCQLQLAHNNSSRYEIGWRHKCWLLTHTGFRD